MTVVGLHPEELFDKLLDGEINAVERERLRQHLDGCEVCRFEYAARMDFQEEALSLSAFAAPPALALPLLRTPLPIAEEPARMPVRRRRSRLLVWGLAAAALITASGAVASVVTGRAPWRAMSIVFQGSGKAPAVAPTALALAKKQARPAAACVDADCELKAPAALAEALVVVENAPSPVVTPPEPEPESLPLKHPSRRQAVSTNAAVAARPVTVEAVSQAVAARVEAPADRDAGVKEPAKEVSSPAKLFGEANQARRSGDIGRASGLYHLLQDQYPGSAEAELSRVTLALLLLDSGDAQAALRGFERYLAGGSRGLEAEALVGRARALGRLGRRDLETTAWREVQRKYPRSIYGRQATERLAALGQP